jgi:two-component system, cell cycle sensor histidine kinase and response regulator CckA
MGAQSWLRALRVALIYAVAAGLWILFSDRAVAALITDHALSLAMQTWKGWAFVAVTATLLFFTLRRQLRTADRERLILQSVISAIPGGVFLKDRQGRFILANALVADLVGAGSPRELVGRTDAAFSPKEAADAFLAEEERIMASGEPVLGKEESFLVRGTERWTLTSKAPVTDGRGHVTGLVGIALDITDRRNAEGELARERMYLQSLMDNSPDFIYFKDLESRFLMSNRAHAALVGLGDPSLMAGKTDFDFFDSEVARQALDVEREIIRTGEARLDIVEHEAWYDGREIWITSSKLPLKDRSGRIIGTFGISRDVTAQKESERALRESEERYRGLFLNAPFGIFRSTVAGREIEVNPAHARIFGYGSPEEMVEQVNRIGAQSLFQDGADRERMFGADLIAGAWRRFEGVRFHRTDATPITATVTVRLFPGREGGEDELEGFVEDTTERARAAEEKRRFEEQLQHAAKMEAVGTLAGGIAHDFNNLLTVISGYGELALGMTRQGDPVRGALGEIGSAARRAASLTAQLLAFSRRQILQPELIDIDQVVGGMMDMLQRLLGEDVELRMSPGGGRWTVRADPGKLEQVVMNLAVNARDAMPRGGRLTLETSNVLLDEAYAHSHVQVAAGEYVLLSVSDTGHGMDAATQERVFEPFFTTKGVGKGTGLGLATVYGIVSQSGGHVTCSSVPGEGTTFRIYLPRATGVPREGAAAAGVGTPSGGTEAVLLVEDDTMVRTFSSRVLAEAGYRVLTAADGAEALRLLDAAGGAVGILVTDVVMPGMDGRTVAREVLARTPGLPVLYLSGYTQDAIVSHGVLEEGVQLLQKPFSSADLLRRIRALLDGARAGRES